MEQFMFRAGIILSLVVLVSGEQSAAAVAADSERGARLFDTLACVQCHSIRGKGGQAAPDLARGTGRDYTPSQMAAVMWNHAPTMWSAMKAKNVPIPRVSEADAADLFAHFYSVRFFDTPADAAYGKQLMAAKHCDSCHALSPNQPSSAKPVPQWLSVVDPISLVVAMWTHSADMRESLKSKNLRWPALTGQEMSNIAIYARNLPGTRKLPSRLEAGKADEALYNSRCGSCHKGNLDLLLRPTLRTMNDIAAGLWNHRPMPRQVTNVDEMRQIATHLWNQQVLGNRGDSGTGERVFARSCGTCHAGPSPSGPALKGGMSPVTMVSALWSHGPKMLAVAQQKNVSWPRFTRDQMSDLIAYLNTRK
jgi:mono/diheme cytochrome c family protein